MKHNPYISAFFLLLSLVAAAQTITVKKGKVLWDGKPVAQVKFKGANGLEYYTLDKQKIFEVETINANQSQELTQQFLKITSADSTQQAQVDYEILVTSLNVARTISHLLAAKYGVFTENGISQEALQKLYGNTQNLEEKYDIANQDLGYGMQGKELKQREEQIRRMYYPQVTQSGLINSSGTHGKGVMGYYSVIPISNSARATKQYQIYIYDLDHLLVASLNTQEAGLASKEYPLRVWDDKNYIWSASRYIAKDDYSSIIELVVNLMCNGYMLQHQIRQEFWSVWQEKYEKTKALSKNIYGEQGYYVDEKGKKYEGKIYLAFERVDPQFGGVRMVRYSQHDYGQKGNLFGKGTTGIKEFEASNGNYFCLTPKDGEEVYYYAMKTEGNAVKKLLGIASEDNQNIQLNPSYFYKAIKIREHSMLLEDPINNDKYIIKTVQNEKGFAIDERGNKKLSKALANYLSDCKVLSNKIKNEDYNLKFRTNLVEIVEQYEQCKQ